MWRRPEKLRKTRKHGTLALREAIALVHSCPLIRPCSTWNGPTGPKSTPKTRQKADLARICGPARANSPQPTARERQSNQSVPRYRNEIDVPRGTIHPGSRSIRLVRSTLHDEVLGRRVRVKKRAQPTGRPNRARHCAFLADSTPKLAPKIAPIAGDPRVRVGDGAQATARPLHRCPDLSTALVDDASGVKQAGASARPRARDLESSCSRQSGHSRSGRRRTEPAFGHRMTPGPATRSTPGLLAVSAVGSRGPNTDGPAPSSVSECLVAARIATLKHTDGLPLLTFRVARDPRVAPIHGLQTTATRPANDGGRRHRAGALRVTATRTYSRSMTIRRDGSRPWLVLTTPAVSATR